MRLSNHGQYVQTQADGQRHTLPANAEMEYQPFVDVMRSLLLSHGRRLRLATVDVPGRSAQQFSTASHAT